jgi:hypothetical protein
MQRVYLSLLDAVLSCAAAFRKSDVELNPVYKE